MKVLQPSHVLFLMILSCMGLTEGQMGRWSKCFGFPPSDSFKAPDGKIVAWSPEEQRPGRADPKTASDPGCIAYFPKGTEVKQDESGSFFVLRSLSGGLALNGKDYKWISYRDYIYGRDTCNPVKFDQTLPFIPCFLRQARLEGCTIGWHNRDILGLCNEDDGSSWATTCNNEFKQTSSFTMTNADVLCMTLVARREMIITHVDVITPSNVDTKPWMVLSDNTQNGGSTTLTWKFSQTWTKKTISKYSEEHGWRLSVSTTYSSGLLSDSIAKWQVTAEAQGHGKYVTTDTDEETVGNVYERNFNVPPRSFYSVTVTCFKQEIAVPYVATEKFFDANGNFLGDNELRGTWRGVSTFAGSAVINETPLEEGQDQDKAESSSGQHK